MIHHNNSTRKLNKKTVVFKQAKNYKMMKWNLVLGERAINQALRFSCRKFKKYLPLLEGKKNMEPEINIDTRNKNHNTTTLL